MSKYLLPPCLILSVLLACCKKVQLPDTTGQPGSFSEVFDHFWVKMNSRYVFWDMDTTRWDDVYRRYKPLFARLDLHNAGDVSTSLQYFKDITGGLTDGHYSITFSNSFIAGQVIFPAFERVRKKPVFHSLYPYTSIDTKYLDPGYKEGYDSTTDPTQVLHVLSGTIQNKILYFTCNKFLLLRSAVSTRANGAQPVLQYFFSILSHLPSNIKGIIIDVRGNGGGNLSDLNFLVGRLIDKPLHFGYTRSKNGNGRLDYTPWVDAMVNPTADARKITIPIIVLADIFSASMAEIVVMAIHTLPNGTFIGETTWGATGAITGNDVYNAGQFDIPGFLSVYTASTEFKYLDGKNYEEQGFPPGIVVPFDHAALDAGHDPQMDKAISLVNP